MEVAVKKDAAADLVSGLPGGEGAGNARQGTISIQDQESCATAREHTEGNPLPWGVAPGNDV
jgi:hypothetical protein